MSMADLERHAADARRYARNATRGFYVSCVCAAVAVVNAVLMIAGVYGR